MRVLMLVQHLEESHWLRGFIVNWVRALAAQVDHVDVITLEMGQADLPDNVSVQSMGKERGYGRARELLAFHRAMLRVIRDVDVVFSHMTPRYCWIAAPYAALFRKSQVLWFTHRQISPELRLATAVCRRVVTAAPDSFPLATPKLRALGHGIDTDFFAPVNLTPLQSGEGKTKQSGWGDQSVPTGQPDSVGTASMPSAGQNEINYIVHVSRLMPIKHQATLIRALALLTGQIDAQAVIVGAVPDANDPAYLDELKTLAKNLGVVDRVTFTGALPALDVRDWYRRAAVAVNLSPVGLFDKAVLEGMATGAPVITSNPAFDSLQGKVADRLRIDSPDDVDGLAARIRDVLAISPEERQRMTAEIRERVIAAHGLEQLVTRLVNVFKIGEP